MQKEGCVADRASPDVWIDGPEGGIIPARDGALEDSAKNSRIELQGLTETCTDTYHIQGLLK